MSIQKGDFVKILKGNLKDEVGEVTKTNSNMVTVQIYNMTLNIEKDSVELA